MKTLHLRIHGHVQGVGYRDYLRHKAQRLGVTGWVRNRADGTVEALVCGPAAAVDTLLTLCHRGPPLARVTHIASGAEPLEPEPGVPWPAGPSQDFVRLPSA